MISKKDNSENSFMILSRPLNNMAGGLEKSVIDLANYLSKSSKKVVLVTFENSDSTAFYPIHSSVYWVKLTLPDNRFYKYKSLRWINKLFLTKSLISQFNVRCVVAFQDGNQQLAVLLRFFCKVKIVAAEREHLSKYNFLEKGFRRKLKHFLVLLFFDIIQIFFEQDRNLYPKLFRNKVRVAPNLVKKSGPELSGKNCELNGSFLFVGRLDYPKNPSVFVNALIRSGKHGVLIGQGAEELFLREISKDYSGITFKKPSSQIEIPYEKYIALVNVSLWEGFPNVVAEALASGTPVIGFAQTPGVNKLVINGINGVLISGCIDAESLSSALNQFDSQLFSKEQIIESVDNFSNNFFEESWSKILNEITYEN
jgi:glycosyltransferase involved in cell wall biosynthesis